MDYKRILLSVVVLVVICLPTVYADDFLDSLREQCALVRQNLNIATNGSQLEDSVVAKYIREGYCILAPAVKGRQVRDTIVTVQYQEDYVVATGVTGIDSTLIEILKVRMSNKDTIKTIKHAAQEVWDTLFPEGYTLKGRTGMTAHPSYYDWVQGRITLYPVPYIAGDTIIIDGVARVHTIMTDSTFVAQFPVIYRPLVTTYATVRQAEAIEKYDKAKFYWELLLYQSQIMNLNVNWGILSKETQGK